LSLVATCLKFVQKVLVDHLYFEISIVASTTTENPPTGFLFLCPTPDFRSGASSFRWPDCPAYWCLDPFGIERLNTEEAIQLGFPTMKFKMAGSGHSCDGSVYAGLRQLHREKGFSPDSQNIARHLGEPLYQLASEIDTPFVRGKATFPKSKCETEC
jgi:hypothetical protein